MSKKLADLEKMLSSFQPKKKPIKQVTQKATPAKARAVEVKKAPPAKPATPAPSKPAGKGPSKPASVRKAPAPPVEAPRPAPPPSEARRAIVDKSAPLPPPVTPPERAARAAPKPGEITEQVFKGKRGGVEVTIGFDAEGNVVVVSPKPFAVVSTVDVTIRPWRNEA